MIAQRFRKKPVVIEAMHFTGWNPDDIFSWKDTYPDSPLMWVEKGVDGWVLIIQTLEGDMAARPGWWIIRGVKGEFYPCDPEIFQATYEPEESVQVPKKPGEVPSEGHTRVRGKGERS